VLKRMAVRSGVQQIKMISTAKPVYAGADPFLTLIDRHTDDNVIETTG
jgi:ABC-2 type transport system permease protein